MRSSVLLALVLLAGCDAVGGGASYGVDAARDGANFRLLASEVVSKLNPVCPYTQNKDELARYEPLRARYQALTEWVAKTPFKVDLVIVESEYSALWDSRVTECGETDTEDARNRLNADLESLGNQLTDLEKMAGMV